MANAKTLVVGGQPLNVIDDTARSNAQTALNNAEYNRQGQIGKYGGQNIATILAGEIGSGRANQRPHHNKRRGDGQQRHHHPEQHRPHHSSAVRMVRRRLHAQRQTFAAQTVIRLPRTNAPT